MALAFPLQRQHGSQGTPGLDLVWLQHKPGDRRNYFSTPDDIWQIVRTLVEERKKRENVVPD